MPHTADGSSDPSMLGAARYARSALDFYPTEPRCTEALLEVFGDDLPSMQVWEPFAGDGGISIPLLKAEPRALVSTDIKAYPGEFEPDALFDFFKFQPPGHGDLADGTPALSLDDIEALGLPRPDAIITNPPYDNKETGMRAANCVRHALRLMEPESGFVAFLLRNEWDCAKKHRDLTEHPAYRGKIVLRFRPRWIRGSKGSPRHNYAWYVWDWTKAKTAPGLRPEVFYAG